jgi:hypothetical protein
MVDFAAV